MPPTEIPDRDGPTVVAPHNAYSLGDRVPWHGPASAAGAASRAVLVGDELGEPSRFGF
jgi:hypothetical protein